MPIYEYHCSACGADFERLVRGDTRVTCPSCEGRKVKRRISLPSRPAGSGGGDMDFSKFTPPSGGGCGGGGCACH